jgi:dTDP-4-amino-4,6-dideoxygalactose transaminase
MHYTHLGVFKRSELYYQRAISLPIFPTISTIELNTVVGNILNYFDLNPA